MFDDNVKCLLRSSEKRKKNRYLSVFKGIQSCFQRRRDCEDRRKKPRSASRMTEQVFKANHNLERCPGVVRQEKNREV